MCAILKISQLHNIICNTVMRRRVLEHMRIAKTQISLRICAVWSRPSLSAVRIVGYNRMYQWRANARMILCTCAGWTESAHFARRHFFALRGPWNKQSVVWKPAFDRHEKRVIMPHWNAKRDGQDQTAYSEVLSLSSYPAEVKEIKKETAYKGLVRSVPEYAWKSTDYLVRKCLLLE